NNAYLIKSDDSGLQALNGQQARLAGYWSQDIFGDDVFNAMAIRHADGVRYACEEPKWAGRSIAQAIRLRNSRLPKTMREFAIGIAGLLVVLFFMALFFPDDKDAQNLPMF